MPDTQVVVVGAGPVGLLLAGELRLGGADVVVLERLEEPTTESRASTLHARTMEIFDSRGLWDGVDGPASHPHGHFAGIPVDLTLPGSRPGLWKVPQFDTELLLARRAAGLGADVRRGQEVRTVTDTGADVEVETGDDVVRTAWLVACDGEDSTVRRLLGADFPGHEARRELLRADVTGIDIRDRRFERLPDGLAVAARRADGVTRVMVHEHGAPVPVRTGPPAYDEIARAWKRVTGEDVGAGTPLWVNAFDDTTRQLTHYRHGRVLFAGDAAHRQPPIGGQALNLGLHDAFNLGWKLAAEVTGRAHPDLLDTYHAERHPAGARALSIIEAQALLLFGGPEVEPVRALLTELIGHEPVRAHLASTIGGLDVHYDGVGARWPHSTEPLRAGRGLLLGPTDLPGGVPHAPAEHWTLVRPDGHTVWADPSDPPPPEVLARWFTPPTT
ncbi:FAD-dependent monooxygenase [Streptomyces sp. NPDC057621]|uniref:FAD-dependent monooxygenase n=1 Tax=unclassified Streptomyces TaxID=2593676 RepID=UPI0036AE8F92